MSAVTISQRLAIVELRRKRMSHASIAAIVGVSVNASKYWAEMAGISPFRAPKPLDVERPQICAAEAAAARVSLRREIEAAKRERATAPLFRCRPAEIDRFGQ